MLTLLGVSLLGVSILLLVFALAVRFAGNSKPLGMVDYRLVSDTVALHRAVGNRMFLFPAMTLSVALCALQGLEAFLVAVGASTILLIAGVVWILHAASKFQRGGQA